MTATADATKDTESATCPTPDGGFEAGDSFDVNASASDYGYKTYTGKKETEVTGLKNGQPYKLGAVAQDSFNNYSKVSNTLCATPGVTRNFWDDYTDSGGKGGKFCFIATAAFGSYDHPVVQLLRRFRDHFLEAIPGGEHLVAAYYRVGPSAAAVVEDRPALRGLTVGVLTLAAGLSLPLSLLGPLGTLGLALAAFGTLFIRRRIRLHRSK